MIRISSRKHSKFWNMNNEKFESFDNKSFHKFCAPQQIERDLNTLTGILKGIIADTEIKKEELCELVKWIKDCDHLFSKHPYSELVTCISKAISDKRLSIEETEDIIWICEQYLSKDSPYYNVITSGIQQLHGILRGIKSDKQINKDELVFLEQWLFENKYLENTYPYQELLLHIYKIMEDNEVTEEEQNGLLAFCEEILSGISLKELNRNDQENFKVESSEEIRLQEMSFCITGASPTYTRKEIAEMIELYGGFMIDSISKKLNYLVICDEKSSCWAFVGYGRKVEKAMSLNKSGANIRVIHETCIYEAINKLKN